MRFLDSREISDQDISERDFQLTDLPDYLYLGKPVTSARPQVGQERKTQLQVISDFGHLPDARLWRPGDLLLFAEHDPDPMDKLIIQYQMEHKNLLLKHARWHHAAVFTGGWGLCESMEITGVRADSVFQYVGNCDIRVRRLKQQYHDTLAPEVGHKIAIAALRHVGTFFGYDKMMLQMVEWMGKHKPPPPVEPLGDVAKFSRSMMCSDLYLRAVHSVTRMSPVKDATDTCPGELSESDDLVDLGYLRWIKLKDSKDPEPPSPPSCKQGCLIDRNLAELKKKAAEPAS